jgi:hypothetical protein
MMRCIYEYSVNLEKPVSMCIQTGVSSSLSFCEITTIWNLIQKTKEIHFFLKFLFDSKLRR